MYVEFHKAAVLSCKLLLKPIVKLLVNCGLSYREFDEIAKVAYLDAVTEHEGASPNISLAAVRTGISRKAIRKLLKQRNNDSIAFRSGGLYDLQVLELWKSNKEYLDNSGRPLPLHYSGEHRVTLKGLISEVEADFPPSTILKRLLSANMINIDKRGRYFPQFYSPMSSFANPENLVRASLFAAAHVNTISINLSGDAPNTMLERQISSVRVSKHLYKDLLSSIENTCSRALSEIEDTINGYKVSERTKSIEMIGIGMYSFNYELPKDDIPSALKLMKG